MAAGSINFQLADVSRFDKQFLVNGHVFTTGVSIQNTDWEKGDQLSFTLTLSEGIYKVDNLTRPGTLYFQVLDSTRSISTAGNVTHLKKTQWRTTIATVDCAACLHKPVPFLHKEHEVVVFDPKSHVFVTPAGWQENHEVSLILDPPTGKRTLVNHTISDAIYLP